MLIVLHQPWIRCNMRRNSWITLELNRTNCKSFIVYLCNKPKILFMEKFRSIKDKMLIALYEQAINNLIEKKNQLDKDFINGLINYAEYEEHKWIISNEIESLKS